MCITAPLHPELYESGRIALDFGVEVGSRMAAKCTFVIVILCLYFSDIPLCSLLVGESWECLFFGIQGAKLSTE